MANCVMVAEFLAVDGVEEERGGITRRFTLLAGIGDECDTIGLGFFHDAGSGGAGGGGGIELTSVSACITLVTTAECLRPMSNSCMLSNLSS